MNITTYKAAFAAKKLFLNFFFIYSIALFSHNDMVKTGDLVVGNVIRNTCLHLADHALLQR